MASKRSIRPLIGTWLAYWSALAIVGLGPAAWAMWKATRAGEGNGTISGNYGDGRFTLSVIEKGVTTYNGSISLLALGLWVAGPPLVAWLWWAIRKKKPEAERV